MTQDSKKTKKSNYERQIENTNFDCYEWFRFSDGYYQIFTTAYYEIIKSNRINQKELIYPLLQLYCLHIETMLKAISIKHLSRVSFDHKILNSFNDLKSIFKQTIADDNNSTNVINPCSNKDLQKLKNIINLLCEYYDRGDLRYPNIHFDTWNNSIELIYSEFEESYADIHKLLVSTFEFN